MEQRLHRIEITTRGRGLVAITDRVCGWAMRQGFVTGLLTIWCRHTSASLLVQENASPDVQTDLEAFFRRLVPDGGGGRYRHEDEGPDDMPAHIRAALTQTQLSIPLAEGQLVLGTWQGIYLWEHRTSPHPRELVLHLLGDRERD
ncbi:secondary thiamine-phosphate synthase enzyme YjbQ [Paeniroseomonas aquatica]|uniref:Secondary thiamine-phosphate synthase enzyme YjbQ n=1 Tax=Paeniroseomonas aquatica TaxID=373043 RepID=A0ABT8A6I1_9PROT|nr:secondary thiamine-phosphate synthase enzyme YjbQ [Paeniroseomonas aquatica]MDN3565350.1 secondary thiamine-phosphate synthase enzyme YjbQ [Paeniroseomonas aquatica]